MGKKAPVYNVDPKAKKLGQSVTQAKVDSICAQGKCYVAQNGAPKVHVRTAPCVGDPGPIKPVHAGNKVGNSVIFH
eukprot:m.258324 g.258324  ORF g.258324 m.258324 type:complete len:76 (+) comp36430_c0_seq1:229-456(+)